MPFVSFFGLYPLTALKFHSYIFFAESRYVFPLVIPIFIMNSIRCKFNIIFLFFVYWFVLGKEEATCVVVHNFSPNFNVCANGQVIRMPIQYVTVPPMHDLETNTQSKDVIYSPLLNLTARIFLPLDVTKQQGKKLPVIVYYHGGLFSMFSYANPMFNSLTRGMSADSNAIVISVDYRLAPEQHLPVPFEDSWTAIQWIASHVSGNGPEEWLNSYADFDKFFLMGDSAGATISVNMALRFGERKLNGINLLGMILQMPYFINLVNLTTDDEFNQRFYYLLYPTAYGTNNLLLYQGKRH